VFLGDLFKVWLALPAFRDRQADALLAGFRRIRARGVPIWFVVGNREFFLPRDPGALPALGLPFDAVIHDAAVLAWAGRRYGLTHGDLVNREDSQYLKWRRLARSRGCEALFRAIPGPLARRIAIRLERSLAATNREIKIRYPRGELEAFAAAVLEGLDGFFIGHFHRDEEIALPGRPATLRIVPDWFSRRTVLRLHPDGTVEPLVFPA
jgi:UDP-2,3-diacylglucosamine hydrolase